MSVGGEFHQRARPETPDSAAFSDRLADVARATERVLDRLLSGDLADGEAARPRRLLEAMRYATLGGGKRLRPFLVVESAALFAAPVERALTVAAALECVHCYSLIHDDLPAMDDDDLRRGRPTVHRQFDEATAILAGDALLTLAFDILAMPKASPDAGIRIRLVGELARAAGLGGMVGGQALDLAAEGRYPDTLPPEGEAEIAQLQSMKTGTLIRFAVNAGAIIGEAGPSDREALSRYGRAVGQAFQIADDLLDAEGEVAVVGKRTGKDAAAGKATLVSHLGATRARARLHRLVEEAGLAVTPFGPRAANLIAVAEFIARRNA